MIKPTATIAFRRLPRIERDWSSPVWASGFIIKTAASGRVRDHVAASSPCRLAGCQNILHSCLGFTIFWTQSDGVFLSRVGGVWVRE